MRSTPLRAPLGVGVLEHVVGLGGKADEHRRLPSARDGSRPSAARMSTVRVSGTVQPPSPLATFCAATASGV